jgi:rod shape determining protein RodA
MTMFEPYFSESQSRIDRLQLAALAGLMFLGAAFVYSATVAGATVVVGEWYNQMWVRQIIWYGIGAGAAATLCLVNYHTLARWSVVAYWVAIWLLVLVLFFGTKRFGARRWFDLGFFSLQPSEFAKLAFILAQANFLSRPVEEIRTLSTFVKALGLTLLPFVLILKEPDLGSALVLLPMGMAMLYVAGCPKRYLVRLIAVVGVLGALFLVDILFAPPGWWQVKLEDYQRRRLLVYFNADSVPRTASAADKARAAEKERKDSYQVRQALISVGSGGLTGKGWHKGNQTALGFLPPGAAHNDFIFSVIAEEKGFVGSLLVLTLYGVVLFTGIRIAGQARDRLGKIMAVGVVTLLFSHVFINIGMNIRIVPVTGIPLPLLSYGGSSVMGSLIAIGILQNVYIYRKTY